MTKVLVVGADMEGERQLLERLQAMASLPSGSLQACRDLDECDLLIVRDRPGLRNAAMRMRQTRPSMRLWLEDTAGALHNGSDDQPALLAQDEIIAVLCGQQAPMATVTPIRPGMIMAGAGTASPSPAASVEAATAANHEHGSHAVVRALRRGLRARSGHALLCHGEQPILAIDFANAQAVSLDPQLPAGLGEAIAWLSPRLGRVSICQLEAAVYARHEQQGQRLPLRALLWQAGQQAGGWNRIDARLQQGAVIHLQGWPDFRVLARQQDVFRLCSLLVRRPSSLADCVKLLDLAPATVLDFVHSAFLAGYVNLEQAGRQEAEPAARVPAASSGGSAGGLLARMWRSVRGAGKGA